MKTYKLGSLFDGSGGFPFAGRLCGIEPAWASEIEPYPIAVTKSHFPNMKHLGDITKINGAEIEPVDIITFGSPCQDLSIAGRRAGLKHKDHGEQETTRSGLFMEAIRIIKEMREATNGEYPTFAFWENAPGAFSSNKGEDFRIVLEELIKIAEPDAVMPSVPQKGWAYADYYRGDGFGLSYRVFDAQYWGVPQRRRRIHLILDLGGERAGEILFEREGLRGYFEKGRTPWKTLAGDDENSSGADDREGTRGAGGISCKNAEITDEIISPCFVARAGAGGNQLPLIAVKTWDARGNGDGDTVNTITGDHENRITDYTSVVCESVVFDGANVTSPINASNPQPGDPCHTLSTDSRNYAVQKMNNVNEGDEPNTAIRRLTPIECARLQGFPDLWGDIDPKADFTDAEYQFWLDVRNTAAGINGKQAKAYTKEQMVKWYNKLHTDSAEYKMWGNGIALPSALYCMQGIAGVLNKNAEEEEYESL